MSGNGSYKRRSLKAGALGVRMVNLIVQFCFAMGIRVSAKLTLGNKNEPEGMQGKWRVLTGGDVSSLVIDYLCDRAGGENATVACFYFDFAAKKEQPSARVLGCLLRQLVFGLEEIPEEISKAYRDRKNGIGGQTLKISSILQMLRTTSTKTRAFICIDALDECAIEYRAELLDSLNHILQQSPGTRMFITGRPHILPEMGRRLAGRVTNLSISAKRDDIVTYLHSRLAADTTPDAMDSTLEAGILKKIPGDITEMYVEATRFRRLPQAIH